MHLQPIINSVQAALSRQSELSNGDPAVDAAVAQMIEALAPSIRIAAMEIAEQAAAEVRAQLPEHTVDVVLSDGDPSVRVAEGPAAAASRSAAEDLDARITLRLPPSLKQLIEDAAGHTGESVNAWVVEALGKRARTKGAGTKNFTQSFDL
ncbi:MAG: hisitidine kinase [Ilumatobacteraceae bacterium]|nr:hisitidine kinase [Ilumatobacteraceae bacterium]